MTYLDYDSSGFIVGINRMKDGIDNVHDDTQEIIQILKSQNQIANTRMSELARAIKDNTRQTRITGTTRTNRSRDQSTGLPANSGGNSNAVNSGSGNQGGNASSNASTNANRSNTRTQTADNGGSSNVGGSRSSSDTDTHVNATNTTPPASNQLNADNEPTPITTSNPSTASRERDANGRFISGDGDGDSKKDNPSTLSKLASAISNGMRGFGGGNNVDPILESFKEAKDLLAPLGRGAKLLGRGAKMGLSKVRALKRREPLPQEQSSHNRENEKLLDKIWKAILKSGSGGGAGGIIPSILPSKNGVKKALKALTGTPGKIIAGIAGSVALASNWDKLSTEEAGAETGNIAGGVSGALAGGLAGATIGSIVPVVGTTVGAVVGAGLGGWLGSDAGTVLGQTIAPTVKRWTDGMTAYNLPAKMQATWDKGTKPFFARLADAAKSWFQRGIDRLTGGGDDGGSEGGDYSGEGGDYSGGESVVTAKADKAGDTIAKNAKGVGNYGGRCAFAVRTAIQAGGYTGLVQQRAAKGYTADVMNKAGFSTMSNETRAAPKKGDVMVFAAQGKHTSGHIQMYDGKGWVSDTRQKSDMPYGDIKAENAKYAYYRDTSGGVKAGTGNNGKPASGGASAGKGGSREAQAMNYFMSVGWSRAQAAGIVGNFHQETGGFAEDVISGQRKGDGGKAVGIAQWHPDRQQDFKKAFGKNLVGASFLDQLKFAQFELTRGKEQNAGNKLKKATTPAQAGAIVSEWYERPKKTESEKVTRGKLAEGIYRQHSSNTKAATNVPAPVSSSNGILSKMGYSGSNALVAANQSFGASPSHLPAVASVVVPNAPKIVDRVDSGGNKPIVLQASNDTINQNVSDRGLAHAITGGLGQDRYWG